MKKNFFAILAFVTSLFCLTSCDEDTKKAMRLSGDWQGDFGAYYECTYNRNHRRFETIHSYFQLTPDYPFADEGTGIEVDEFMDGPIEYLCYHFDWRVRGGVIEFFYDEDPSLDVTIEDYKLNYETFKGYFAGSRWFFKLNKLYDYDWDRYDGLDCYYHFYDSQSCDNIYSSSERPRQNRVRAAIDLETAEFEITSIGHKYNFAQ